jgi:hypothetical protein
MDPLHCVCCKNDFILMTSMACDDETWDGLARCIPCATGTHFAEEAMENKPLSMLGFTYEEVLSLLAPAEG